MSDQDTNQPNPLDALEDMINQAKNGQPGAMAAATQKAAEAEKQQEEELEKKQQAEIQKLKHQAQQQTKQQIQQHQQVIQEISQNSDIVRARENMVKEEQEEQQQVKDLRDEYEIKQLEHTKV